MKFRLLITLVAALAMVACSDNDSFKIDGTVAGNRTMNLRILYNGEDNINNVLTAARDGKFTFEGHAPKGAMVEILDNDYRVLGRLYATDGDEIKVTVNPASPTDIIIEGNDVSQRWAKWINENAAKLKGRNAAAINAAVAKYVGANSTDILSTLLLVSEYDASINTAEAEKLASSIAKEVRPDHIIGAWLGANERVQAAEATSKVLPIPYVGMNDSLDTYRPADTRYSLLTFTCESSGRNDTLLAGLRRLHKEYPRGRRLGIVDFSLDDDTNAWRRVARADSVTWPSAWAAGSLAAPGVDRLGISALPFYVVVDSTGRQIMRTRSATRAIEVMDSVSNTLKKTP